MISFFDTKKTSNFDTSLTYSMILLHASWMIVISTVRTGASRSFLVDRLKTHLACMRRYFLVLTGRTDEFARDIVSWLLETVFMVVVLAVIATFD